MFAQQFAGCSYIALSAQFEDSMVFLVRALHAMGEV
jgi:hypothetical protein